MVEALFIDGPFNHTRMALERAPDTIKFPAFSYRAAWVREDEKPSEATVVVYMRLSGRETPSGTVLYVWRNAPGDDCYALKVPQR